VGQRKGKAGPKERPGKKLWRKVEVRRTVAKPNVECGGADPKEADDEEGIIDIKEAEELASDDGEGAGGGSNIDVVVEEVVVVCTAVLKKGGATYEPEAGG